MKTCRVWMNVSYHSYKSTPTSVLTVPREAELKNTRVNQVKRKGHSGGGGSRNKGSEGEGDWRGEWDLVGHI